MKINSFLIPILHIILPVLILLTAGLNYIHAQNHYIYPLRLKEGKRYLVDSEGKPFFWEGEAAWSLIAELNREDVVYYLDDREQKGFTVLLVNLIEHKFSEHAPADYYKDAPFTGKPFITPGEKYFSYADFVIREAGKRGMAVLLCPLYLGYQYGDEGWGKDIENASPADLESWGEYVGKRYSGFKNIIWCIGGDADPSLQKEKVLACVKGILKEDRNHLFTAHNAPEQFAISPWEGERWLSINDVYTYSKTLYSKCKTAYDRMPEMPYYLIESAYENEHNSTPVQLRSEACWPVLCGSMGFVFGNCPIWNFSSDSTFCTWTPWKTQLNNSGSVSMMHLQQLFRSRPWYELIPDFSHRIVTHGYGEWGNPDYVTAAITADSSCLIAYIPAKNDIKVDLTKLSGNEVKCWWYNPGSGKAAEIGVFKSLSSREFDPPSDGDWILVIDDNSHQYSAPGKDTNY